MKTKVGASALLASLALTTLTGCGMTDDKTPSAGVSTTDQAISTTKSVSSELYDLIGLKGTTTKAGVGLDGCPGKDPEKYFSTFHVWTLTPATPAELDGVMERLKEQLPGRGWKVVGFEPDNSRNKNLRLTADHDARKHSVEITYWAKNEPPKLNVHVISGCYQVPEGEKVE
ncbi:hypothetical protein HHL19_30720 [Streptomyces sp. R302]|uniref:hypothetical protein n=1 Tax=unclassified Streptomyces TaxID=2593676 RepID=UPI00145E8F2B|nr:MULTISPECIES: hypothetical protein [unclassified Streptomyces]NML53229.1 hypothetical protein [Streptomyces sp. R301]NML82912.1 hypothetical protein [Streptomyces sp. R302]